MMSYRYIKSTVNIKYYYLEDYRVCGNKIIFKFYGIHVWNINIVYLWSVLVIGECAFFSAVYRDGFPFENYPPSPLIVHIIIHITIYYEFTILAGLGLRSGTRERGP